MYKIVSGATGTGKSQYLMAEYKRLVEEEKVPSDKILVLLMNRSQSLNWRKNLNIKMSNKILRTSFFGFIQNEITTFYPIILKNCPEIKKHDIKPAFLTFEASQYLFTKLIEQKRIFSGAFAELTSKDSKIAIDLSSNFVKAVSASLSYDKIGTLLYNSLENKTEDKKAIFEMADKIIHDYRKRCLECGVMDFAIALDLYTNVLLKNSEYIAILKNKIKYILVDNLEEAVPAQIDFLKSMKTVVDNMILVYNNEGGYGSIFGANRQYVEEQLLNDFEIEKIDVKPYTCKNTMVEFSDMLFETIAKDKKAEKVEASIKCFPETQLRTEMLDNIVKYTKELVDTGVNPSDIAYISTFADPVTEYILSSRLEKYGIELKNISRKSRFIDNKFVHALITLGYLCHPHEKIIPNRDDIKSLIMMVLDMDPIRSSMLAGIVCNQNPFAKFPKLTEEDVIDKIGYMNISKYEFICDWINNYREQEPLNMDEFFQKVFVEILLVYGADEEDIVSIKRLIDSAKNFSESVKRFGTIDVNREFLKMIKNNVKSAESIFEMEEENTENSIIFSTPLTYLSNSLTSKYMIIIGLSSDHWLPRCVKELSNPYVLTPTWNEKDIYSEELEEKNQRNNIAIMMRALLKRCEEEFITFESRYSGDGYENDGILPEVFRNIMNNEK